MRLAPKKIFYLFIKYNVVSFKVHPLRLHTFSSGAAIVCSIPGTQLVGCPLRPALQPSVCLLLTQNVGLSLLILPFEKERSRKVRDQVSKEAATSQLRYRERCMC
jgi:hypothetical protein